MTERILGTFTYNRQWRIVEERIDGSTNPSKHLVWHPEDRYILILRERDTNDDGSFNEHLYCLKNAMDPVVVVDESGTVQERYEFTAFGATHYHGSKLQ